MSDPVKVVLVSGGRGVVLYDGWAGQGFQNHLLIAAGHTDSLRLLAEADPASDVPPFDDDPFGYGAFGRSPLRALADPWSWSAIGWEGGAVLDFDRRILTWYATSVDWSFGVVDRPILAADKSAARSVARKMSRSASQAVPERRRRRGGHSRRRGGEQSAAPVAGTDEPARPAAMEAVADAWNWVGWTVVWASDGAADLLRAAAEPLGEARPRS
ncbi:MAG: hypothetical protein FWH11_11200 [Micrococcales bacterium]|nr:hypothetical protein [Micrococcales bacterium]